MIRLTQVVHERLTDHLSAGDIAIDATAGNGHDTQLLASLVGPEGRVFAFDIQHEAIATTGQRVEESGFRNVELFPESHANLVEIIPRQHHGEIAAVVFNLGYLPGGDKRVTTLVDSTARAVHGSLKMVKPGGLISLLCYVGHPGGDRESAGIDDILNQLNDDEWQVETIRVPDAESAPHLHLVSRLGSTGTWRRS